MVFMLVVASVVDIALLTTKASLRKIEKYFVIRDMNDLFMDKGTLGNKSKVKKYKFKKGVEEFFSKIIDLGLRVTLWICSQ